MKIKLFFHKKTTYPHFQSNGCCVWLGHCVAYESDDMKHIVWCIFDKTTCHNSKDRAIIYWSQSADIERVRGATEKLHLYLAQGVCIKTACSPCNIMTVSYWTSDRSHHVRAGRKHIYWQIVPEKGKKKCVLGQGKQVSSVRKAHLGKP